MQQLALKHDERNNKTQPALRG